VKLIDRGAAGGGQNAKAKFFYYNVYFLLAFDCILIAL